MVGQQEINDEQRNFLKQLARHMENQALLISAMTKLVLKYELLIEKYSHIEGTLQRVETKIDIVCYKSQNVDELVEANKND